MTDMVPQAIDQTNGQTRPVTSGDILVDTSGNPISSNHTTVLAAGSTVAEINTALTNFNIVYLAPGSYPVTLGAGSQITIPDGKTLRGLNVVDPSVNDANTATFTFSGVATSLSVISFAGTGWVSDLFFNGSGGTWSAVSSNNGIISAAVGWVTVERIGISSFNDGNYAIYCQKGGRLQDIFVQSGSFRVSLIFMVNGDANRAATVKDVVWNGSASSLRGIHTQSGANGPILIDNILFDNVNFSFAGIWIDGALYSTVRNCFFSNCGLTVTSSAFINIDSHLCSVQNCIMVQCGTGAFSANAMIRVDVTSAQRVMISDCTLEMAAGSGDGILWSGSSPSYGCSISNVDVHGVGMTSGQVNFQLTATSGGSNRCAITDCRGITSGSATLSASTTGWNVSNVVAVT
jgi:hypothetical protein